MDPLAVGIVVGAAAVTAVAVALLNRVGSTPRIPPTRIALFAGVSLVAGFVIATGISFLALRSIPSGGSASTGSDLVTALTIGAAIDVAVGGAGIVGCVLGGVLASRWSVRLGSRVLGAASGAILAVGLVILVSGLGGAALLGAVVVCALVGGAIAPWPPGFLRAGTAAGSREPAGASADSEVSG